MCVSMSDKHIYTFLDEKYFCIMAIKVVQNKTLPPRLVGVVPYIPMM